MTTRKTRFTMTPRAAVRAALAPDAERTEPKPGPVARVALSERVRAALRCASSAPFVAKAPRPNAGLVEPAPFICG